MGNDLTSQETMVLNAIACGLIGKEIKDTLNLSEHGYWQTIKRLHRKLGAHTTPHMIKIACDKKII